MKRRKFIAAGSTLASGLAFGLPAFSSGNNISVNNTLNIGIIGTGGRGNWLIKLLDKIPGMEVMACCDILPFRLEQGMSLAHKKAKSYTDYRELLAHKDLDAVIISTPLSLHYKMAKDALNAGLNVYCEKSMTFTIDEALSLEKHVKDSGKAFQVGYQHRYNPLYHKIYETINGGYIGDVTHVEAHWNRNGNWRRPVPDPQFERIINWRMYKEFSGGLMAELSSHQVDLTDYLLNGHVMKATGFGGIDYWKDGRETFDNIYVNFEYPNGVKASYHSITTNGNEGFSIKFFGTKATVAVDGEGGHLGKIYPEAKAIEQIKEELGPDAISSATMEILEAGEPIPIVVENFPIGDEGPTSAALTHFGKCVRGEAQPIANVEFGKKSAIAVVMANTAMREEKTQYWKDEWSG